MTFHSPPLFFFFNDTATTEIYTLSLHDALPISFGDQLRLFRLHCSRLAHHDLPPVFRRRRRSEEHTSELQSRLHLVCRLLLEKKKEQALRSRLRPPPSRSIGYDVACRLMRILTL